ncbi:hypothetical protein SprV_0200575300 [Sparganum proliferum]
MIGLDAVVDVAWESAAKAFYHAPPIYSSSYGPTWTQYSWIIACPELASEYLLYAMPALLFAAWYKLLVKYIQAQSIVIAPLVIAIIGNGANALFHYLLLFHAGLGIRGSAIAQSMSFLLASLLCVAYLYFSKSFATTWGGYRKEMWQDWKLWFGLAIPGLFMLAMKWSIFGAGTILTGNDFANQARTT